MEGSVLRRRRHSAEFKARVLEACSQPGASIAGVALEHGLNANVVHKWRRRAEEGHLARKDIVPAAEFVSLPILPEAEPEVGDIRISIRRGSTSLDIQWPVSSAQTCARWLGEVLK
ncbi:MAG: transposase [Gammaproteobacteria bacterium]|nr:transposase [Gammaproteobacteria bacterium]